MLILNNCWVLLKKKLAMLTEDLMASFAFEWHVWEFLAHDTADLVYQLLLKLVLDLIKFDVNAWDWLWSHDLLNSLFWDD
jgi:hypothetical protein